MSSDAERQLDDAHMIHGGSPTDRVIGMLLERTQAVRELHDSMRGEFREMIDTHADVKRMMVTMAERLDRHEKSDTESFGMIGTNFEKLGNKLDLLGSQILNATTSAAIQKAQFNAGWKVLAVTGGLVAAAFAIFAIFFNHKW